MTDLIRDGDTNISADIEWRRCAFAHSASLMAKDWANLDITAETMSKIVGDQFDEEVSSLLYDPNDSFMDTVIRERVLDAVSRHYLGISWPRYKDQADIDQFDENLTAAIESQ